MVLVTTKKGKSWRGRPLRLKHLRNTAYHGTYCETEFLYYVELITQGNYNNDGRTFLPAFQHRKLPLIELD